MAMLYMVERRERPEAWKLIGLYWGFYDACADMGNDASGLDRAPIEYRITPCMVRDKQEILHRRDKET